MLGGGGGGGGDNASTAIIPFYQFHSDGLSHIYQYNKHGILKGCQSKFPYIMYSGAQWLSGRVFDSRPRGRKFEPHWHHCLVSLSKAKYWFNPGRTERLLMGRKESNQTKQTNNVF